MHGLVCMNTGAMLIAKTALRSQNLMQSKADHWRASMISPPLSACRCTNPRYRLAAGLCMGPRSPEAHHTALRHLSAAHGTTGGICNARMILHSLACTTTGAMLIAKTAVTSQG